MDKSTVRAIQLLCSLLLGDREPSVIPFVPSKTEVPSLSSLYFKRRRPSKCGLSPVRISDFLAELEASEGANVHGVMILKNGCVVSEAYAPGFERGAPHLSHSMTKTVTAIAAAILADEGKLHAATTLAEVFFDFALPTEVGEITVGDVLTMATGKAFSELGAVTSERWLYDYLASSQKFPHGEGFHYNSMNSYVLARIIEKRASESFCDYVRSRLFEPLGIRSYFWERSPEGTEKGGWGLYMSLEDWLKIAALFINGGKFENKTIVSHLSLLEMLMTRNPHSIDSDGEFDYAGHLNMHKRNDNLLLNGLFGQDVYIDPTASLAVAINAGSSALFKSGAVVSLLLKYFPAELADEKLDIANGWRAERALRKRERSFRAVGGFISTPLTLNPFVNLFNHRIHLAEWDTVLGKYLLPMNNLSPLPVIARIIQNNLVGGIDSLELVGASDGITLRMRVGDTLFKIPAGFGEYKKSSLDVFGEKYRVSACAAIERTDEGKIYKIAVKFPELPNERYISFIRRDDGALCITFSEAPGIDAVLPLFEHLGEGSALASFAMSMLERKLGEGFMERRMGDLFSVTLLAPDERSKDRERILDEENTRITEERKELLSAPFISKFIRSVELYEECDEEDGEPEKRRGFLKRLAGLFIPRRSTPEEYDEASQTE